MDFNELLKKKLKAEATFAYKFDRATGNYYVPEQSILQFPAGTSLAAMKEWLEEGIKTARSKRIDVDVTSMKAYTNGIAVIAGRNVGIYCTGISTGRVPPPPKPQVIPHPHDFIRPAIMLVNQGLQVMAVKDSDRLTNLAEPMSM